MPRRDRTLADLPERERVYSRDRRKIAAFWIAARCEDRYDDDTTYWITVWDRRGRILRTHVQVHKYSHMTGVERGSPVVSLAFLDDARLEIRYAEGPPEVLPIPDEPPPIPDPAQFNPPWR